MSVQLTEQVTVAAPGEDAEAPIVVRMVPDNGATYVPWNPATVAMLREMESVDFTGKTVLDFGAGSGILGLVAAAMGAGAVFATEYIPKIERCTQANIKANGQSVTLVPAGDVDDFTPDIILANIGDGEVLRDLRGRCDLLIGTAETTRKRVSGGQGEKPVYAVTAHDVASLLELLGRTGVVTEFDDGWAVVRG